MADNILYPPGSGEPVAADEIAGVKHQRIKVQFGVDGSATDVSSSAPLPVALAGADPSTPPFNVAASTSSTQIVPANASRRGLVVLNDSAAVMYLKYGTGAAATSLTYRLGPRETYEMQGTAPYKGVVHAAWASADGFARVTELV